MLQVASETYDTGRQLLLLLDDAEARYLDSLDEPTAQELTEAAIRVQRLRSIRDLLDSTKQSIEARDDPARQLRLAVMMLSHALGAAKREGLPLPPAADQLFDQLQKWSGQPP